jgi:hypothetical protein
VKVYRHLLVLENSIELWAEPGEALENHRQTRIKGAILRQAFWRDSDSKLSFLRVSKMINFEAADIFYGENKFRLSDTNGHMVAFAFVTKIGKHNLDLIKTISIAAPFRSSRRGKYGENWNPSSWIRIHEIYDRMPFPYQRTPWRNLKRYARLDFHDAWSMLAWKISISSSQLHLRSTISTVT